MSSSLVSDPNIVDKMEYAIVVGRNRPEGIILFLCSSQREATAKLTAEVGDWFLHNGEKLFRRIRAPVPTEVFQNKKGEDVVQAGV